MTTPDAPTTPDDTLLVYVRECVVPLFVGIYEHEKSRVQPLVIDVEATMSLTQRYDDLLASDPSLIIDYDRLYHFVASVLPTLGHIAFLESVAERIVAFCFEDPRIRDVHVRIHKPESLKGKAHVGIDMRRHRRLS